MRANPAAANVVLVTEWPELALSAWDDTRVTFHMWAQIVGKIRLALEPMVNHWWQVPLYVSARGLTTALMHDGATGVEIEFDLVEHVLDLRTTDGRRAAVRTADDPDARLTAFLQSTYEAVATRGGWDRAALEAR